MFTTSNPGCLCLNCITLYILSFDLHITMPDNIQCAHALANITCYNIICYTYIFAPLFLISCIINFLRYWNDRFIKASERVTGGISSGSLHFKLKSYSNPLCSRGWWGGLAEQLKHWMRYIALAILIHRILSWKCHLLWLDPSLWQELGRSEI